MSFRLIKGVFAPRLGRPDGDSVRFKPNNINRVKGLKGKKIKIYKNSAGERSVQLRYEGIDTMEKAAATPYSSDATKENMKLIGGPGNVNQPDTTGYILTRRGGPNNRPICFVYAGTTSESDGSSVYLDVARMKQSVNYKLLLRGHAYPMFYNTLFADLREPMADAVVRAWQDDKGVWAVDRTMTGVTFSGEASLDDMPPIFPKLWRRLKEWAAHKSTLNGFIDWLAAKNEHTEIIYSAHDGQFEDVVQVSGNQVWMTEWPEDLKFRSQGT